MEKIDQAIPLADAQDDIIVFGRASIETKGIGVPTDEPFGLIAATGISE